MLEVSAQNFYIALSEKHSEIIGIPFVQWLGCSHPFSHSY